MKNIGTHLNIYTYLYTVDIKYLLLTTSYFCLAKFCQTAAVLISVTNFQIGSLFGTPGRLATSEFKEK